MADLFVTIAEQPDAVLDVVAASMDRRAADPAMARITREYLSDLPKGEIVAEIGCGNGAASGTILEVLAPAGFIGIDPAARLLSRAASRHAGAKAAFREGSAAATGLPDASVDVAVAHTVFSHLPDPAAALAEVLRILRPGGVLAVFDGDYAMSSVALFPGDPLQAAMEAVQRHRIHDLHIMRRLPALAAAAGFEKVTTGAHGFVQTDAPDYMTGLLACGTQDAMRAGEIGAGLAAGFAAEAQARAEAGRFYGAMLFVSVAARKPG